MTEGNAVRDYLEGKLGAAEARDAHRAERGLPPFEAAECCGGRCDTARVARQREGSVGLARRAGDYETRREGER